MARLLRWDRCDAHLPWLRISRHRIEDADPTPHRHDFAEWCWAEDAGVVHLADGRREALARGDARFLRPGHDHALAGSGVLVTASVPGPLFAELERRYRGHESWPWADAIASRRLDEAQLRALDRLLQAAPDRGQERVDAEWFVAATMRILRRQGGARGAIPPWLERAVATLAAPSGLAAGLAELVRRSGRSPAHVSRAVRRAYGCTATELVHRRRCEWAARELRLGTRPISAIAADAGYAHLGHFYRRFAQVFATTPRAYRHAVLGEVDAAPATGRRNVR